MIRFSSLAASILVALISTGPGLAQDDKQPLIIMVSGPLFDPFFSALKKGADDAAAQLGITYQYSTLQDASNVQADLARLTDQAVAAEPDVLVIGNFFPDATGPIIKRAAESGIPVIIQDGGYDTWKETGAFTYVGYDPGQLGVRSGKTQVDMGVKDALCINHVPGNPTLEALCNAYVKAVVDAGGAGKVLTIALADAQNPQAVLSAVKGALESDTAIDGILTLGATQTTLAAQAASETGHADGQIKIGGMGLSTKVLEDIRDGKVSFGIDLQAYLDGYYGLIMAYQKAVYDFAPVEPIFVGPRFVYQADAQNLIDINSKYQGIRGTE